MEPINRNHQPNLLGEAEEDSRKLWVLAGSTSEALAGALPSAVRSTGLTIPSQVPQLLFTEIFGWGTWLDINT